MRGSQDRDRQRVLLLEGAPGAGKTTVIRRAAAGLEGRRIGGFTTEEIRNGAERLGFRLETFDGRSIVLAHVDIRSAHRIGRYGVDVEALDGLVDSALALDPATEVYLIDEIGKMECLSSRFVKAVATLLDSTQPVVATIAARGGGLIANAKRRSDAEIWTVRRAERDDMPREIVAWVRERLG